MPNYVLYIFAFMFIGLVGAAGWWFTVGRTIGPSGTDVEDKALVALGESIYARECAACHGANLEGQTPNWRQPLPDGRYPAPPHDATGHTWHHPDAQLFNVTKFSLPKPTDGRPPSAMPAYANRLTGREIWAVLSFIKSRWPEPVRRRHDYINERYAAN